jgi:LmbE family N-acetylglucosaminyl deacetylase
VTSSRQQAPSGAVEVVVTPPGNDPAVWRRTIDAARRIRLGDLAAALEPSRGPAGPNARPTLLVASAHPDDETIGAGRLAAGWAAQVGPVVGQLATAGEACVDHVTQRPADLATRRLAEWQVATTALGFTGRQFLGLPDGRLAADEKALVDGLRSMINSIQQRPVVLATPWRHDPHPDHRALGRAGATVAGELDLPIIEFGVWMTYWSVPDDLHAAGQSLLVLDHDPSAESAYAEACRAFGSQLQPLGQHLTPVVPAEMLEQHRSQLIIVSEEFAERLREPQPGREIP